MNMNFFGFDFWLLSKRTVRGVQRHLAKASLEF